MGSTKSCCTGLFEDELGDIPEESQTEKDQANYLKYKKLNIYRRGAKGLEVI